MHRQNLGKCWLGTNIYLSFSSFFFFSEVEIGQAKNIKKERYDKFSNTKAEKHSIFINYDGPPFFSAFSQEHLESC